MDEKGPFPEAGFFGLAFQNVPFLSRVVGFLFHALLFYIALFRAWFLHNNVTFPFKMPLSMYF